MSCKLLKQKKFCSVLFYSIHPPINLKLLVKQVLFPRHLNNKLDFCQYLENMFIKVRITTKQSIFYVNYKITYVENGTIIPTAIACKKISL